jgi:hypothetical protein
MFYKIFFNYMPWLALPLSSELPPFEGNIAISFSIGKQIIIIIIIIITSAFARIGDQERGGESVSHGGVLLYFLGLAVRRFSQT